MVPTVGIEPTTARLQVECSTVEPCRQSDIETEDFYSNSLSTKYHFYVYKKTKYNRIDKKFSLAICVKSFYVYLNKKLLVKKMI